MPITCTEIEKLEKIQRDYFRYIPALRGLNYWDQLNRINMISIQRRLERYRIIYSWKILENLVPNCGLEVVVNSADSRHGRRFQVPSIDRKATTSKQLDQVFEVNGPKLFNCLPARIRNRKNVGLEDFKMALDMFLASVPDQPKIDGLTPGTQDLAGVYSNSILYQTKRGQGGGQLPNSGA